MIPHERTPLTYAEQQTLLELERSLERRPFEPDHRRTWPCQLAGVAIVAASALLVGGLVRASSADTSVVLEVLVGVVGLLVGAALAVDPVRRYVRSIPPAVGIASWRRRRLARQLSRTAQGPSGRFRRSGG